MKRVLSRIFDKIAFHINHRLFVKQWIIGVAKGNIKDIIKSKSFDCDITWLPAAAYDRQQADPFFLGRENGKLNMFIEDVTGDEPYGKIAVVTIDGNFRILDHTVVLDTQSHLSYPFVFEENGVTYVFPEAAETGKLSCYKYDADSKSLEFIKHVIDLPLLDSNILKYYNKYWIFGVTREKENPENYELRCFYSDNLLGPYKPHAADPPVKGLDGVRGAGNIIEVDGTLYRPTQNCSEEYGKSITIQRILQLDETAYRQEAYMTISIDRNNKNNKGMRTIHTINALDDIIVVDGMKWAFSPFRQHREILKEMAYLRRKEKQKAAVKEAMPA